MVCKHGRTIAAGQKRLRMLPCLSLGAAVVALTLPLCAGMAEKKEDATTEGSFDCEAGYGKGIGDWETAWPADKVAWCCKRKGIGCHSPASPPYDCVAGLPNWKLGWSVGKKLWCCRHKQLGCEEPEDEPTSRSTSKAPAANAAVSPAAQAALAAEPSETCGVAAVLNKQGYFKPPESLQPVCNRHMATNCSVSYASMQCPSGCDYLVPNHRFVCVFECVPKEQCSASNPNRAFADPETGLCLPCSVEGCRLCESRDTCSQCHDGFELNEDGSACVFYLDKAWHFDRIVTGTVYVVVALVLLALVWRCVKGAHHNREENLKAIMRARRHRHLCKVHDWQLGNAKVVREMYPLTVNVHQVHILGVGLPLFYNSICFLAVIAILFAGVTYFTFTGAGVGVALASTDRSDASLVAGAVRPQGQAPAVVLSPLSPCGHGSAHKIMDDLRDFATTNYYAIGLLYVLTFAISLVHGKWQLAAAKRYDMENKTMSDYALRLSGLKKDETNEAKLTSKIQEAFRAACPQPESAEDSEAVEVVGVSICYDYSKEWGEVDAMRDRFLERMDLDLQKKMLSDSHAGSNVVPEEERVGAANTSAGDEDEMRRQVEEDRKQARAWFDADSKERLRSTGELFVVFRHIRDVEAVWAAKEQACSRLQPLAECAESAVELSQVFSEPPSINWWHLAVQPVERNKRVLKAMLKISAIITCVQLLIVLPYSRFILWPYSAIGSAAGGAKMQVAGAILGVVNTFVGIQIWLTVYGLGFHRKDGMDMMVLCSNTALGMINTFFNIITACIMVFSSSDDGFGPWTLVKMESLVAIGVEGSLAANIYNMMMPGTFFVGYLMCIVMAGLVPFAWNSFLMKVIYVWRCLPDSILKVLQVILPWAGDLTLDNYPFARAEKGFEPMDVGISGDYSAMIVNPSVCFCMLFFVSPYVWKTFFMMFLSMCFYYCFCRYQHLRFCKAAYYTTNRLDTMVNFLWGIPLSIVAAAWCLWGLRSGHIAPEASASVKLILVAAAFKASLAAWLLAYRILLDPWRQHDAEESDKSTFEDVKADMLYTWFNCNPVYALKCEYYFKDACRTADSIARNPDALQVSVISARGLRDADWVPFMGSSEPYCVVEIVGKPHSKHETHGHKHGKEPVWNFSTEFAHYTEGDSLRFTILDKDFIKKDDVLGQVTVSGDLVAKGFSHSLKLEKAGSGVEAYIEVAVHPPRVAHPQTRVCIKGASGLRDADWIPGASRSDPYVVCDVVGKPDMQIVTPMQSHKTQPVWDFTTGLDMEPNDTLVFTVLDADVLKRADCLGQVTLTAAQIRAGVNDKLPLDKAGKGIKAYLEVSIEPNSADFSLEGRARGGHPLASGEDSRQVRFFQTGKEYLFVRPERQGLVHKGLIDVLEFETYLEYMLRGLGSLVGLCSSVKRPEGAPRLEPRGDYRPVLLGPTGGEPMLVKPAHGP